MGMTTYLESKPRYEILDGLRGVAAVMVVLFHLFESYASSPATQLLNHGYLAVDFFFLLSGYVVGYAYDDRWAEMTTWGFFKRRLVRLHPMVVMGTVIGAALYYFGQGDGFPLIGNVEGWKVGLAFVMGLLMIPCGMKMDIRGWGETNSFNGPTWSLMWEYLANILYAVVLRRLGNITLGIAVGMAAMLTLDITLNIDTFGLLAERPAAQAYTVIGGWSLTPEQLYIGAIRLLYPFLMGMMLSRTAKSIRTRNGFWWCSALLILLFWMPCLGGEGSILNGIYNAATILLFFPLIVLMGAGSTMTSNRGRRICNFLGEISYPLYITHFPIMYVQMQWAWSHAEAPLHAHITVAIGAILLSLGVAYGSMKLYDAPVRKWLTDKVLKRVKR